MCSCLEMGIPLTMFGPQDDSKHKQQTTNNKQQQQRSSAALHIQQHRVTKTRD
jgi:hypothetical protein